MKINDQRRKSFYEVLKNLVLYLPYSFYIYTKKNFFYDVPLGFSGIYFPLIYLVWTVVYQFFGLFYF